MKILVRRDELVEYEKEYLNRLTSNGKIIVQDQNESTPTDEEIAEKIKQAERIQAEAAAQIQIATEAKIQSEVDIVESKEKKRLVNEQVLELISELQSIRSMMNERPVKRKTVKRKPVKRKPIKKKSKKRSDAAKKAARTRKRKVAALKAKRSTAAKKAARTRKRNASGKRKTSRRR